MSVSPSNGFMLFDMGGLWNKEDFQVKCIKQLVLERTPILFKAIEWEPEDGKGTRYLNLVKAKTLTDYIAVSKNLNPERMNMVLTENSPDTTVAITFEAWKAGTLLKVGRSSIDVALLQPGGEKRLGEKYFAKIFKETARVLKPKGQFIIILEAAESLPPGALVHFTSKGSGGPLRFEEGKFTCYQLFKKAQPIKNLPVAAKKGAATAKASSKAKSSEPSMPLLPTDSITADELWDAFDIEDEDEIEEEDAKSSTSRT